ncbi:MAG: leucine-rich repeat domain-containing protein [Albidovulum sp.]
MRRLLLVLLATGIVIWQFLEWNTARQQLAIAEQRVQTVIADEKNNLSFSDLTKLRVLPGNIEDVERLEYLVLRGTNVSDITRIKNLHNLKQLDLNFTRVTDLTPLTGLSKLRLLHLHGSWVKDLSPLATLPSLERLDIGKTQITSLEPATRIVSLNWLSLHAGYALDGSKEYYDILAARQFDLSGGSAFREDYRPGLLYQTMARGWRLREMLEL